MKAYFAAFQCMAYTSGVEAVPMSPSPAARASGAISKKGTAVFSADCWACAPKGASTVREKISSKNFTMLNV